jgi:hypothetical protein
MKFQNSIRMHAIVIGFGAALLLASSASAQEIDNPTWDGGPNTISLAQPAPAPAAGDLGSAVASSRAMTSDAAIAKSLATQETLVSQATSVQGWMVASLIICFALAALYVQAETRRRKRNRDARGAGRLNTRATIS